MPSRSPRAALHDIAYHIELAERLTAGFELATFKADERTLYAVTRCLEIISEASRRLSPEVRQRHPTIPWRNVAAAGNIYRHEYEAVDAEQVWEAVRIALPDLKRAVAAELARMPRS